MSVQMIQQVTDDFTGRTIPVNTVHKSIVLSLRGKGEAKNKNVEIEMDVHPRVYDALAALFAGDPEPLSEYFKSISSPVRSGNGSTNSGESYASKVRAWAKANSDKVPAGVTVGDRGVVSAELIGAYEKDQATNSTVNGATGESHSGSPTGNENTGTTTGDNTAK